jgi:hypothetical protein
MYRMAESEDILQVFAEPVASLFYENKDCIIAAGKSGRIVRYYPQRDTCDVVIASSGFREQLKVLPAAPYGLLWSLRDDQVSDGTHRVLSIVNEPCKEEVLFANLNIIDVAVSGDGCSVCVAGSSVQVLRRFGREWKPIFQRDTVDSRIEYVTFLGVGDLLGIVWSDKQWMEIWQIAKDLPTVAMINLSSQVTCLSGQGHRLALGCRSGEVISLSVRGRMNGLDMKSILKT